MAHTKHMSSRSSKSRSEHKCHVKNQGNSSSSTYFKCHQCQRVFSRKAGLTLHQLNHARNRKSFSCPHCKKSFTKKALLDSHIRIHAGSGGPFKSNQYNQEVESRSSKGPKAKSFKCSYCNKSFTRNAALSGHVRTHFPQTNPFNCSWCEKAFPDFIGMNRHIRTHTKEKPYKCTICGKAFASSDYLNKHLNMHTRKKRYFCPVCNWGSVWRASMIDHIARHDGDDVTKSWHVMTIGAAAADNTLSPLSRQLICNICSKGFESDSKIRQHIQCSHKDHHRREKPWHSCEHCGKKFPFKYQLIGHMRVHTSKKSFICEYCQRTFSQRATMIAHLRTHTGEKMFKCEVCNIKEFTKPQGLTDHKRNYHGLVIKTSKLSQLGQISCPFCHCWFSSKLDLTEHYKLEHIRPCSVVLVMERTH